MQAMKQSLPLLAALISMSLPTRALTVEGVELIRVQVEYVEMPHAALTDLLMETDATESDATVLRQRVQEMVKKGEAKVLETMVATSRSGEQQTTESIQEMTYATEYEPAEVVNQVNLPDKPEGLTEADLRALDGMITPATPVSFETRNVGSTLEIEPRLGANRKIIDLRIAPNLVWFTGNTVWQERKDRSGNNSKIQMPVFYSLRFTGFLTLVDGKPVLAAVNSPRDEAGKVDMDRKVLTFVKATVQEVK